MVTHVALLRGINVGGKNLIRMPELADAFTSDGYGDVSTYIQSGNVLFSTGSGGEGALEDDLERMLLERFQLPIRVVVRSRDELAATVAAAPADHGAPHLRSDVIFLKHPLAVDEALAALPELRDGVDAVAPGPGVLYFSRLDAQASRSRMSKIVGTRNYQLMTIRNWRTTTALLELMNA
ncbi:MAG TPA: DUF1697 domain-containing protein [Terrimesophilobacter sp.]|nr:DUF1697 domain-containing protein [Terrimesophilobacter sp.]